MKFIAIILFAFSLGTKAFAQNLHMIEMSTNNTALGALVFSNSGGGGQADKSNTTIYLGGNYAYKISPRVQLGVMGDYYRSFNNSNVDAYGLMVGGIYNFDDNLTEALYVSLYGGFAWFNYYDRNVVSGAHQESAKGKIALGKRFPLTRLNLPNVTYSPEISYSRTENNRNSGWSNQYQIRFLQFSVFF